MPPSGLKRNSESEPEAPDDPSESIPDKLPGTGERLPHPLKVLPPAAFLALTFLLGFFPLKDTDFWWHLRTGDLIRTEGRVPHKDLYTYTVPNAEWIDLHWGFQVLISLGYQIGGVPLLNLAKAVITTAAVGLLLLGCRRRGWPMWVAVIAWLPGLLVLSGRMYVRPETLSLMCMSVVIWVVFRWLERPRYVWLLPAVFLCWVNIQGLFALGFVILAMGILDAALRPSMWRRERREWWGRLIAACSLSVIACLINPYGLRGLLFPFSLVGTMGNPVFRTIGELTPIPQFIRSLGIREFPAEITFATLPQAIAVSLKSFPAFPLPMKMHLLAMVLGLVSFAFPLIGWTMCRIRGRSAADSGKPDAERPIKKSKKSTESLKSTKQPVAPVNLAPFSPFRAMMWGFFSLLSLQATRNSHQFAAAMGFVTAANMAEGTALFIRARRSPGRKPADSVSAVSPGNAVALALVSLVLVWVATGEFYRDAGEGRTIGWGEEPLWFPHEAVKAAGAKELPPKFASFHNGHAALYDYYFGPERKVYSDARLEVIGAELYQQQNRLTNALSRNEAGWRSLVSAAGRPVMLADHASNSAVSATLFTAKDFACIHFDPIAAVFAPVESISGTSVRPFDFLQSHYDPNGFRAYDVASRLALTRAMRNIAGSLAAYGRDDLARPMNLAGIGLAANLVEEQPTEADHWKLLGQLLQTTGTVAIPRESAPVSVDPVEDLAALRTVHALSTAAALAPNDFSTRYSLMIQQRSLKQLDQERDSLRILAAMTPINTTQATEIENARARIAEIDLAISSPVQGSPSNTAKIEGESRAELERSLDRLIDSGRIGEAAKALAESLPSSDAPADLAEKLFALQMWLGQVDDARKTISRIADEPRRAVFEAVAMIVEGRSRDDVTRAIDKAGKIVADRPQKDPSRFATASLKALHFAEIGDPAKAREALEAAQASASTPAQRDFTARLGRLIP